MEEQEPKTTVLIVVVSFLVGFMPAGAAFATYFTGWYWRQGEAATIDLVTTNSVLKDRKRFTASMANGSAKAHHIPLGLR